MSRPFLPEHQAEVAAAAAAAPTAAGPDAAEENGEHAESGAAGRRTPNGIGGWTSIAGEQRHYSA